MADVAPTVLEIAALTYRYPEAARPALVDIDLEVAAGEFIVLAGRSGSGKSTLLRAACGLVPHFHGGEFAGDLRVDGRSIRDQGPAELALSVGFVAQEPESQVVSTTVAAELELPLELRGQSPLERARAVEEVALALAIEPLLGRAADTLSGGELQRVAIGAALVTRPPLLLLDEPTSQLDPIAGDELIGLLRRLNEEWAVTVILGEHRLERCLSAADRVLSLDGGRLAYDGSPEGFGKFAGERAPELRTPAMRMFELAGRAERPVTVKRGRELLARHLPAPAPAGVGTGRRAADDDGRPPALAVSGISVELELPGSGARRVLDGIDLEIRAGETVALAGPNGAGKSTLLRAVAGVADTCEGRAETPRGCALLTQRPDDYFVRERVGEELPGEQGRLALRAVGLDVDPDRDPRDLSGGERQRLALALALAGRGAGGTPPGLICLDEPTRGLDRSRKTDLAEWLRALAGSGSAVLVATHDVEFAAALADRVVLLARGRVLADGGAREVLGGGWYFATEIARISGGAAITPEQGAELLNAGKPILEGREA